MSARPIRLQSCFSVVSARQLCPCRSHLQSVWTMNWRRRWNESDWRQDCPGDGWCGTLCADTLPPSTPAGSKSWPNIAGRFRGLRTFPRIKNISLVSVETAGREAYSRYRTSGGLPRPKRPLPCLGRQDTRSSWASLVDLRGCAGGGDLPQWSAPTHHANAGCRRSSNRLRSGGSSRRNRSDLRALRGSEDRSGRRLPAPNERTLFAERSHHVGSNRLLRLPPPPPGAHSSDHSWLACIDHSDSTVRRVERRTTP